MVHSNASNPPECDDVHTIRSRVEELVRQARLLLHSDGNAKPSARPLHAKRAEREEELERALEKADWYRQETKRLQKELEQRTAAARGTGNPNGDVQERDPLERKNLIAERRKELQSLKHSGEALDRIAEAQRRAEAEQNAMTPENAEKLAGIRGEVDQQKRLNIKLFADRQKLGGALKKAEAQVRSLESELRSRAAELRPPRPPGEGAKAGGAKEAAAGSSEPQHVLRQLQRDADILREAVRQDERKFRAAERSEDEQREGVSTRIQVLHAGITEHEAENNRVRAQLQDLGTKASDPTPRRGCRPSSMPPSPEQRGGHRARDAAQRRRSPPPRPGQRHAT